MRLFPPLPGRTNARHRPLADVVWATLVWATLWAGLGWAPAQAAGDDDFLPVEQAFHLSAQAADAQELALRWHIAPGYHLYRDRISVAPAPGAAGLEPGPLSLPNGQRQFDASLGQQVEILTGEIEARLPLRARDGEHHLEVTSQGCADAGLCYPPNTQALTITMHGGVLTGVALDSDAPGLGGGQGAVAQALSSAATGASATRPTSADPAALPPATDDIGRALQAGHWLPVMGVFWLAGLLLSFTPCVLPMVPILSSIIVGQAGDAPVSRWRGFSLALAYALGMALIYTGLGVLAGWMGEGLAAYLQNPWVLGAFGLLLAGLALSMFGVYELQVPAFIQGRLSQAANGLPGGQYAGVFAMGGLSALIVGPCVAAPLAGALVYIGQTHDLALGGAALFAMAMGMSVPLLLVGVSAGTLLPRAGAWMSGVKHFFGVLLLAVALWLVSPVLPAPVALLGWGMLMLGCAVPLWRAGQAPAHLHPMVHTLGPALALVLALLGAGELVGALSGGRDPLQPLSHLARAVPSASASQVLEGANASAARNGPEAGFERIHSLAELQTVLAQSQRPVMLDFYADWCVACKEMASLTFTDPAVAARMQRLTLVQADVTANSAEERALLKHFGLFGPPGVLFFAPGTGQEHTALRVIGFTPADRFGAVLDKVLQPGG
jgi:thiol:disulfide interchange protein DsbD